jgi:hypothetical protein
MKSARRSATERVAASAASLCTLPVQTKSTARPSACTTSARFTNFRDFQTPQRDPQESQPTLHNRSGQISGMEILPDVGLAVMPTV